MTQRCSSRGRLDVLIVGLAMLLAPLRFVHASDDDRVERYMQALSAALGAHEREVLVKIAGPPRQLLALRAYVRSGAELKVRWSWTDEQIRAYERSAEYRQLRDDIAATTREFERRNPGYTLYANTQVRSLDTQIERWNSNPRVGVAAGKLYAAARVALNDAPPLPSDEAVVKFKRFLQAWRPSPAAPLAAPGLSLHGQSRAVDFQIMKAGRIVAATEVSAVARQWEATGWRAKLKDAVNAASPRFKGPLAAPNEPWHYEYLPVRAE